jgi:hypothetical protein
MSAIFPGPCQVCGARAGPYVCPRCDLKQQEEADAERSVNGRDGARGSGSAAKSMNRDPQKSGLSAVGIGAFLPRLRPS